MTYPMEHERRFLLLSGDSVHSGLSAKEIVDSMRQAMFTVPASNEEYMRGVRERVKTLGLGGVGIGDLEEFLKDIIDLGLAQWVSKHYVDTHFNEEVQKDKKHGLSWIVRRIPS